MDVSLIAGLLSLVIGAAVCVLAFAVQRYCMANKDLVPPRTTRLFAILGATASAYFIIEGLAPFFAPPLWLDGALKLVLLVSAVSGTVAVRSVVKRLAAMPRRADLRRLNSEFQAQLRIITNSMPWLVAYVDRNERYVYVNRTYEQWWGRAQKEYVGKPLREMMPPRLYEDVAPRLAEALAGREVSFETTIVRDAPRRVSVTYVPDCDDSGVVRGVVALMSDITKHKEAEEALRHAKDVADEASRTKSTFLANMSHEIRTPLAAVLGYSELLLNERQPQAERHNYANAIKRNGELLRNIIDDILDLTKVESGNLRIDRLPVNVLELVHEVTAMIEPKAEQKGVQLRSDVLDNVPERVVTDPMRLRQILLNMLGNAVKFTQTGEIFLSVEASPDQPRLSFVVRDTGCGIEPQNAENLFEAFNQASLASSKKYGGTGLGLALSRKLARELGGDLELTTTAAGGGSTFTLSIATGGACAVPHGETIAEAAKPTLPVARLREMRVLLVEDSPDNQLIIGHYLKLAGAVVELAGNGQDGVTRAMADHFDVVLMDIQMPVMDGYRAAAELRSRGYSGPVVALTAYAMKEERERALSAGFDEHLPKPVDRAALLRLLERLGPRLEAPLTRPILAAATETWVH